jgi:predicted RNase H-like HicB family nuclease
MKPSPYTIVLKKSGRQYASLCLELCVVGCGETQEEALKSVQHAIASYLDAIEGDMPVSRPVPLDLLHDFLAEGESEISQQKMRVLAYA